MGCMYRMLCVISLIQIATFAQDSAEFKSIHDAAAAGNARSLMMFIQEGVSVDARDSMGRTPLMRASESGMSRVIPLLLERKADIDAVDAEGNTALHLGAVKGHVKIISELISAGADLTIKNRKGLLAKELAYSSGNPRASDEFRIDMQSGSPYGQTMDTEYQAPAMTTDRLKEALNDPNEIAARLRAEPKLVKDMEVLFKAMEMEEAKWTSRTRNIKNTFLSTLRKEIDAEVVFIQKVAKAEDANDIVHALDVIQSDWKSIFLQSSRKMREASRTASAQGAQTTMRPSRSRSRRGQTYDMGSSRRPARGARGGETVPEVNPNAAYIDSWATATDTGLDTLYQSTQDKFMADMSRVRVVAEERKMTRILNAIDGVMLERKLRGERSMVVYGLTKADMAAASNAGMNDDSQRGARGRRGASQTNQTGRRRR